jgi:hypothetical protein
MNPKLKLALIVAGALVVGTAFGASIPVINTIAGKLKSATAKTA